MQIKLDRLIYQYEDIQIELFQKLMDNFAYLETHGLVSEIRQSIGKTKSQYHYNYHIGEGEGSIFIGYKHNSANENNRVYNMKVEYNPRKLDKGKTHIIHAIQSLTSNKPCKIHSLDFAIDIQAPVKNVYISSLTGKTRSIHKGTIYFGQRGNDGRLKAYDKKKERESKGHQVEEEHLTRIEYTWKSKDGIYLDRMSNYNFNINEEYLISILGEKEEIKAEIRSFLHSIQEGIIQEKELTRTNRKNVKEVMEQAKKIDFNSMVAADWNEIYSEVLKHCINLTTHQL